jgi:ABC-type multidrug transport system ATPase subunit
VNTPAIRTLGLSKRYAELTAVDSLDLSVVEGEIYGFLGRNGAGKTTTIRLLLGLIRPTTGRVLLFGRDLAAGRREAVRPVGSLVETATCYPTLTVRENLEIQRRLTGSGRGAVRRVIALLSLESQADRRAGRLSLGNRQRLALARALLPGPRLLILDEPANALDPAGIVAIRRLLRRLADEERITVFVSSHILAEIAQLADRIGIIHRGRLVEQTDPGRLQEGSAERLEIRVSDPRRALALLQGTPGMGRVDLAEDGLLRIQAEGSSSAAQPAAVARLLVGAGLDLHALCPVREDLEARFLRLTGGEA